MAKGFVAVTGYIHCNLELKTNAGKVMLRNQKCLVVNQELSIDVLFGTEFMKKEMGIDLDKELEKLASSGSYQGLNNNPVDADDESDGETVMEHKIPIGANNESEVRAAVEDMLTRASSEGLSKSQVGELRELVHEHWDVWRTQLGADPPAKVPPMQVRIKPNVSPFRAAN